MEVNCYVCNKKTTEYKQNLCEIKSVISNIKVSTFIEKFLNGNSSHRNVNDERNCICMECLEQIFQYDVMSTQVVLLEHKFRELLNSTEISQRKEDLGTINEQQLNIFAHAVSNLLGQTTAQQKFDSNAIFNLLTLQKAEQKASEKCVKRKIDLTTSDSPPAAKKKITQKSNEAKPKVHKPIVTVASKTQLRKTVKWEGDDNEIGVHETINQTVVQPPFIVPLTPPESEPEIESEPNQLKMLRDLTENENKKYECPVCTKEYTVKSSVYRHLKVHETTRRSL
ncbi:uncharacterized protein LOC116346722 [Contarinia nasturtii]|uniref:uncharacterized protein LOC116346722 n=1 Tax=Contarinia nasturtii TaxID=265458 RepID=UPI0012D3F9EB|nr:uncharacterized protein LOC116346722 [Contarinia nasturtii]